MIPKSKYDIGDLVLAKLAGDVKYEIYQITKDPYGTGPSPSMDGRGIYMYNLAKRETHPNYMGVSNFSWGSYMRIAEYVLHEFASFGF